MKLLVCLILVSALSTGGCTTRTSPTDPHNFEPIVRQNMVVYIIVDGLRLDSFLRAMEPTSGPNPEALFEVFGRRLDKSQVVINNHSTFPSVTFAANASLITGQPVSVHGVAGNEFLHRDTGTFINFVSSADLANVFRRGRADAAIGGRTIYHELPGQSLVSFHFFGSGAEWIKPDKTDVVHYTTDPAQYDYLAAGRLLGRLRLIHSQNRPMPRVVTLYWPGLDELTHRQGETVQVDYVRKALNDNFQALLDGPKGARGGGLRSLAHGLSPYTFVLVSDHGFSDIRRWVAPQEIEKILDAALVSLPEFEGIAPKSLSEYYQVSSNSGMLHVYVRLPGTTWKDRTSRSERGRRVLEKLARALRHSARLQGKIDLVFAACGQEGKLRYIPKGATAPQAISFFLHSDKAAFARSRKDYYGAKTAIESLGDAGGDIVLTADYNSGHAFLCTGYPVSGNYKAVHGNVYSADMRVPLVIAGADIKPQVVRMQAGNINTARIVTHLSNHPIPEPICPLFSPVKKDRAPEWITSPKCFAEEGLPYVSKLVAFDHQRQAISLQLVRGPRGMILDPASGIVSWTPKKAHTTPYRIEVRADNPRGQTTRLTFEINVYPSPPTGVTASYQDSRVLLRWNMLPNAYGYIIRRLSMYQPRAIEWMTKKTWFEDIHLPRKTRVAYIVEAVHASKLISGQHDIVYVDVP